ncbi:enoyl-CoA hydratase-related protein [Haloechinothrix salitolerans]|uniref:Enoyl-CoA hydratase-related protein n=1 Tax=Haloechinothrix salitolerans TaxID=926830 RepID=A0ABW2BY89_9PSEU
MLDLEERDGVAVIHLHGADHNRLDTALLRRLAAAMGFVGPTRPVVLTGHRRTFAIGAEVAGTPELLAAQDDALRAVAEHQAPVVTALNGDALDTGFALAAAADVRLMERGLIGTVASPRGDAPLSAVGRELVRTAFARCGVPMPSGALAFTAAEAETAGFVQRPVRLTCLLDEAVQHARNGMRLPQRV